MLVSLFAWSCWVNVVSSGAMAGLVLISRPLTKVKILWAAMCLAVAIWSAGLAIMVFSQNSNIAEIGNRILYLAAPFIPVFFLHTVSNLIRKPLRVAIAASYCSAFSLEFLNFTGLLSSVAPTMGFLFYTKSKPLYFLFVLHLYGLFSLTGFYLWRAWREAHGLLRRQTKLLFWGTILGFAGGQTTVPLVYGIKIFPLGNMFVPLYVFLVAYGMLQYQFLDFRVAARRFAIILGVFLCLIASVLPLGWNSLRTVLNAAPDLAQDLAIVAALFAIILSAGPVIYFFISHRAHWLHSHAADGLAHELRSPLAIIESSLDLLSSRGDQTNSEYLVIIRRNVARLDMVTKNLLQMAGADFKVESLKQELTDIRSVIEEVSRTYRQQSEMKGIEISINSPPIQAWADPSKLRLVISNLVSNAVKFSNKGAIEISAENIDGEVSISISDQGIGIPREDIGQIFQRFFQRNRGTQGTGLGLTIAKELVEAHGGRIWAKSPGEGKGTVVRFSLPAGSTL